MNGQPTDAVEWELDGKGWHGLTFIQKRQLQSWLWQRAACFIDFKDIQSMSVRNHILFVNKIARDEDGKVKSHTVNGEREVLTIEHRFYCPTPCPAFMDAPIKRKRNKNVRRQSRDSR